MADAVEFDLNGVMRKLDRINQYQVPFAASLALNRMAVSIRDQLRETMKNTFENPVPFTLNSLYIKASNKNNLEVEVGLKEFAPKGNPASKYLLPHIKGGLAYNTRFQKSLQYKQILPPGMYAIPTQSDYIRRNKATGNILPGQYTEILYSLRAFRDSSAFSFIKNSKRKRNTSEYFAVTKTRRTKTGYLYPGIYRSNIDPGYEKDRAIFWFTRTPRFQPSFPLTKIGYDYADQNWSREFGRALSEAIASSR